MEDAARDPMPTPIPERLPVRIAPCPIVESIFELRYATREPWRTSPGLLANQIREQYREQRDLPLADMPEELRRKEPGLAHQPLMQFVGTDFLIQLGPRVVSLVTKANAYPGWTRIKQEIEWLLPRIQLAGLVAEGERLGVRYIDYFKGDLFENLQLEVRVANGPLRGAETQLTTILRQPPLTLRLMVTNGATVPTAVGPQPGSVLDVDAWLGPLDFDVFENGVERFSAAHLAIKQLFFGLLKPEFLSTLSPVYE